MSLSPYMSAQGTLPPIAHPSARRVSILMLIMGALSLLLGASVMMASFAKPQMFQTPEMKQVMTQLHVDSIDTLRVFFRVIAGIILAYGVVGITCGLLVRTGRLLWLIVALVFVILVTGFIALAILTTLASGTGSDLLLPSIVGGLHILAIVWLVEAMRGTPARRSQPLMMQEVPPPLAAYHIPPPPADAPTNRPPSL